MRTYFAITFLTVFLIPSSLWAGHSDPPIYTSTPVSLKAKDVLPGDLIKGDNYEIKAEVKNDGLVNVYHLTTDYGDLTAEGTAELMMRIDELRALAVMEEMDRKDVFGEAVVKGVKAPVETVVDLVKEPVETSKNIVKGTGQFFSNIGHAIVSDDPDQDNAFKVALGYDSAKRKFAYDLGINPYSDYDPAMDKLGKIARAAVAGGLAPRAAMAAIDSKVVQAARVSGTAQGMKKLVRDNPPNKLRNINEEKLKKMGVKDSLIEAFLDNYSYDPQEKTLFVGELESMSGVEGKEDFIVKADLAPERSVSLFNRMVAQMMAGYHAKVAPVTRILIVKGVTSFRTKEGALVVLSPMDYVFWTKKLEDKVNAFENEIKNLEDISAKELWVSGKFDKNAREQFETRGWKVKEGAEDLLIGK